MTFKEWKNMGINPDDGVLITKFLMDVHLANVDTVKKNKELFTKYKYNVDVVPGEFLKIFTMNEKEAAEFEKILAEIDELGLSEVFAVNLRPASFKREFLERVKFCMANNFPYYNEDYSFIPELYNVNSFALYTASKPMEMIKTVQELDEMKLHENLHPEENNTKTNEEALNKLDAEDKQVYNQIIENLNYLILQHPTNAYLPQVVANITKNVINALLRKEYRFLPLGDVIDGVMFDGMDVTPEMEETRELILGAFPEEKELNEGRGLA